jgi:hypothetical protein
MNRFLMFASLLFALTAAASAEVQNVTVKNYANYGNGVACSVDPKFNEAFESVINSLNGLPHAGKDGAILITKFFDVADHGSCFDIKADGTAKLDAPASHPVYVAIIVTNGGQGHPATLVYWNTYQIDGAKSGNITMNPE